jgi:hypothetical protein
MSAGITALDAVTLVRDEPWQKTFVFYTDPDKAARENLTGKTVAAEIRWRGGGSEDVAIAMTDAINGLVTPSLTAEQTAAMPFGRLGTIYIAVDTATRAFAPVEIQEGHFSA